MGGLWPFFQGQGQTDCRRNWPPGCLPTPWGEREETPSRTPGWVRHCSGFPTMPRRVEIPIAQLHSGYLPWIRSAHCAGNSNPQRLRPAPRLYCLLATGWLYVLHRLAFNLMLGLPPEFQNLNCGPPSFLRLILNSKMNRYSWGG